MRSSIDIRDLYRNRRELLKQLEAGEPIDLEKEGRIIARIDPLPETIRKNPSRESKAAGLRTT